MRDKQQHHENLPTNSKEQLKNRWPKGYEHPELKWFPATTRLIGMVRTNMDNFVLPPAVVRKASWRD